MSHIFNRRKTVLMSCLAILLYAGEFSSAQAFFKSRSKGNERAGDQQNATENDARIGLQKQLAAGHSPISNEQRQQLEEFSKRFGQDFEQISAAIAEAERKSKSEDQKEKEESLRMAAEIHKQTFSYFNAVREKIGVNLLAKTTDRIVSPIPLPDGAVKFNDLPEMDRRKLTLFLSNRMGSNFFDILNLMKRTTILYSRSLLLMSSLRGDLSERIRNRILDDLAMARLAPIFVTDSKNPDEKGTEIIVLMNEIAEDHYLLLFEEELDRYVSQLQQSNLVPAFNFETIVQKLLRTITPKANPKPISVDVAVQSFEHCINQISPDRPLLSERYAVDVHNVMSEMRSCFSKTYMFFGSYKACQKQTEKILDVITSPYRSQTGNTYSSELLRRTSATQCFNFYNGLK